MESMDNVRERFEALERQTEQLQQHPHMVARRLSWWRIIWSVAAVVALGLALARPSPLQAKTFHCGAGDVQCLIDAINAANANGQKNTIRLEAGTYPLTTADNDQNGLPEVTSSLTITGASADSTIIARDAPRLLGFGFRILSVTASGTLTIKGITIRGGLVFGPGAGGGGILNSGTLTIRTSRITGNVAADSGGGGISNLGTIVITHSLIDSNSAEVASGGIANGGTLTIRTSTITRNAAVPFGGAGGIGNDGTLTMSRSTISENRGSGIGNSGTMVITNSTIADNDVCPSTIFDNLSPVGALQIARGTVFILNSTIAGNSCTRLPPTVGIGIQNGIQGPGGTVLLFNTILASNVAETGSERDCSGPVTSLDNNLLGDPTGCTITLLPHDLTGDPGLDTFTDNGKPGNGHFPLLPTSQAIDAGSNAVCPRTDQLGRRRIGPCDIGAIRFLDKDDRQPEDDPAVAAQASQ